MTTTAPPHPSILLVEDDDAIRETTTDLLGLTGATVHAVASGHAAMRFLAHTSVDLIVTDLVMPDGDGYWLLAQVRAAALRPDTPIIMLSGHATQESIADGLKRGADAYLVKPFDPEAFLVTVNKFLAARPR